jgi:hypothetical protein
MLVNKKKIEFYHTDNALADIWNNTAVSTYFPPAIWYYLTYSYSTKNEKSLAKLLIDKWILFRQLPVGNEKKDYEVIDLLFGKEGKYNADDSKNRDDMLYQTESYVTLMKQALKTLMYEVEKLISNY